MKDLQKLAKECMAELDAIDVKYGKVRGFYVDRKSKTSWGYTHRYADGSFDIKVSVYLLDDTLNDKPAKDTIFHELIHTCKGCFDHGKQWQSICDLVNDCYGYELSRTSGCMQYNQKVAEAPKTTFKVHCVECGAVYKRTQYRAPKFYAHIENFHCKCGGKLVRG